MLELRGASYQGESQMSSNQPYPYTIPVQCSNKTPCESCYRAGLVCLYLSVSKPVITIGNQRNLPKASFSSSVLSKPDGETKSFQHCFHGFLPQNRFYGGAADWHRYLTSQVSHCKGHFSALAGLGAMTVYTRGSHGRRDPRMLELAIQSYQTSVEFLRSRIRSGCASWNHLSMLSLAFLLSLFEVSQPCNDRTTTFSLI
jgi:hypothetical protein